MQTNARHRRSDIPVGHTDFNDQPIGPSELVSGYGAQRLCLALQDDNRNRFLVTEGERTLAVLMHAGCFIALAAVADYCEQALARFPDEKNTPVLAPYEATAEGLLSFAIIGGPLDAWSRGTASFGKHPAHLSDRDMRALVLDFSFRLAETLMHADARPQHFREVVLEQYAPLWRWGERSDATPAMLLQRTHRLAQIIRLPFPIWNSVADNREFGLHHDPIAASRFYRHAGETLDAVLADGVARLVVWRSRPLAVLATPEAVKRLERSGRNWTIRMEHREANPPNEDVLQELFRGGLTHRDEANALTYWALRRHLEDWHDHSVAPFVVEGDRRILSEAHLTHLARTARESLAPLLRMRNEDSDRYVTWVAAVVKAHCAAWDRPHTQSAVNSMNIHGLV